MKLFSQRDRKERNGRRRLGSESLEKRIVLTASSAGFVVIGSDLFYEVVGIGGDDTIIASTDISGDSNVDVTNADGMSTHSVSAGDIANAQLTTGKTYAGLLLRGTMGDDTIDASGLTGDRVTVAGGEGADVIIGSPNMDTLRGNKGNDVILGGAGDDILEGNAGDDMLDGGAGADIQRGGIGDDDITADAEDVDGGKALRGNAGQDRIDFSGSAPGVGTTWMGRTLDGIRFRNRDFERVAGSPLSDVIDNRFYTSTDLRVWARGGDDVIISAPTATFIDGQSGSDTVSYEGMADAVTVDLNLAGPQVSPGSSADGDEFRNVENLRGGKGGDTLIGNDDANILMGGGGFDFIHGRGGDDILLGGTGGDHLFGEMGNDYLDGEEGRDHLFGGLGIDSIVVNHDRDIAGAANPDVQIFAGGEVDMFLYEGVFTGGLIDVAKINAVDAALNNLGDDNKSDFDEGVDDSSYFDVLPDPTL